MKRVFRFLCWIFLGLNALWSGNIENYESYFREAETAYKQKNYAKAIQKYQILIDKGYENDVIFYNLGTAFAFEKKYGLAVWALKKAKNYNPSDRQIRDNLNCVFEKLNVNFKEKINVFEWGVLKLTSFFSTNEWTILFLVSYSFLCLCLFTGKILKNFFLFRSKSVFGSVLGVFFLSLIVLLFRLYPLCFQQKAVIVQTDYLRKEPTEKTEKLLQLKKGAMCCILDQNGNWFEVETFDSNKGWVHISALKTI